ncbi:hypothetical protein PILCRDRAFT_193928 [Piloderma croceum F 1598]|uniref:Uncharacterized protein n=1 Tax=Piloderma croceum (strain F 1598) TaxID=765440 RepID=A0A0C3GDB7_PILCF|nr:hypothetical protein PILCRDRAFT_193928 [Piloderma croceum F 1598]
MKTPKVANLAIDTALHYVLPALLNLSGQRFRFPLARPLRKACLPSSDCELPQISKDDCCPVSCIVPLSYISVHATRCPKYLLLNVR